MSTEPTPQQGNGPAAEPPDIAPTEDVTLVTSNVTAVQTGTQYPDPSTYYEREEEEQQISDKSAPFAPPIQFSSALPVMETLHTTASGPLISSAPRPTKTPPRPRNSFLLRIALSATAVVVVVAFLWLTVFAQPVQPLTTTTAATTPVARPRAGVPAPARTVASTPAPGIGLSTAGTQGVTWIPQRLPAGWVQARLTLADALFAERTALAFTDREEAIDARHIGTRAQHSGTLTAATFVLTGGGKIRFAQNDVRVANNALFDKVTRTHLVQAAVNAVPSLVKFQVQGQNQFAWVDVSYELFQSQIDPNHPGQRIEGLEMDPATGRVRTHHMSVLLVRVAPADQGAGAPMGGSGWLVSDYGLDLSATTPLTVLQPL